VGAVGGRQLIGAEYLVGVQIGHRDFRRRDQVVVLCRDLEQILLELGQLTCPEQRSGVDHQRGHDLGVAMLLAVQIEHELDQRPFQSRPVTDQHDEACAGDFRCTLEVENAQRRPEVRVILGLEFEVRHRPHDALDTVVLLAGSDRDALVR